MQVMRIFGPFLWAWLADHTGKTVRWIRVGATGGFVVSLVAFVVAKDVLWLIPSIVLLNFTISGLVPLSDSYAMDVCEGDTGKYGRVRLFGSLGFIASVIGFGWWAEHIGFTDYPVWVWGMLGLALLSSLMFRVDSLKHIDYQSMAATEPRRPRVTFGQFLSRAMPSNLRNSGSFHALFSTPGIRSFWAANFFMIFAHGVFYAYFSLFMQEVGYGESTIGLFWGVGVILEVIFFACQGWLMPKLKLTTWLNLTFFACFVRFGLIAAFPQFFWIVLVAQTGHCLTFAAHHTATVSWLRGNLTRGVLVRGQATYATIAYGLGGTSGTLVGRYLWDWASPGAAFAGASLAGALALWFGLKLSKITSTHGQVARL